MSPAKIGLAYNQKTTAEDAASMRLLNFIIELASAELSSAAILNDSSEMGSKTKVTLIPWDAKSEIHRRWLHEQRVLCNWDWEKVEGEWKEKQIKGEKCMYWIVRQSSDSEERDPQNDEGKQVLRDTADSINGVPRKPSQETFVPIGHISLDSKNKDAEVVGLEIPSEGVFWIKSFFILQSMQGQGTGRAAMDAVEDMACREPLCAQSLMLDTVTSTHQMREDFAMATYGAIPKIANQDWYGRRGYIPIKTVPNYYDVWDAKGDRWDIEIVFMRKNI